MNMICNDDIRLTGKNRATIRVKGGIRTETTKYTGPDVIDNLIFVLRSLMLDMGMLRTPGAEEGENLEDKEGLIGNAPPLEAEWWLNISCNWEGHREGGAKGGNLTS